MTRTLKLLLCGYAVAIPVALRFAVPAADRSEFLLDLAWTHLAAIGLTLLFCRFSYTGRKRIPVWVVPAGALASGAFVYLCWLVWEFGREIFAGHFWSESVPDFNGGPVAMVIPFVVFTVLSLPPTLVAMACFQGYKRAHETQAA